MWRTQVKVFKKLWIRIIKRGTRDTNLVPKLKECLLSFAFLRYVSLPEGEALQLSYDKGINEIKGSAFTVDTSEHLSRVKT